MSLRSVEIPTRDIKIPAQYFINCSTSGHNNELPFIDSVDTEHYKKVIDDDNDSVHSGNYWRRAANIDYQHYMEEKTQQDYCRGEDFYGASYIRNLGFGSTFRYRIMEANHYGESPFQVLVGYSEEKAYYPYRGKETVSIILQKIEDGKIHIQAESKYLEDSVLVYQYQSKEKKKIHLVKRARIINILDDVNFIHDKIDGAWCCSLKNHRRRFLIKKVIYLFIYSVLFYIILK